RAEVLKLLDVGIIYPISDSKWVSVVDVVPKRIGITVVKNEHKELVQTRPAASWRVCTDYRKLNLDTRKYYFPMPFIDQMLERLAGYNQIAIAPKIKRRLLSPVLLALLHIGGCLLAFAMPQQHSK
ncbi:transposable element gene, partial [Prunus dulcis]